MKKYILPIIVALLALFIQGCGLLTLHPIFTPDQLVFDNRLTGKWKAAGGTTEFEPASKAIREIPDPLKPHAGRFYLCTRKDGDGKVESRFLAFLVKVGNNYFMDLFPLETEKTAAIDHFFKSHELKMHTVSKIEFLNGSIRWVDFKDNYVTDLIKKTGRSGSAIAAAVELGEA